MNKTKVQFNRLIIIILILLPIFTFLALPVQAIDIWGGQQGEINNQLQLGEKDPRATVAAVINVLMGFLGLIAVLIIILGVVMAAGAGEEKAAKAKKFIFAGVIGLIIILASWGLALFVLDALLNATNAP